MVLIAAVILDVLKAVLATVLIAAGAAKLADLHSFATTLTLLGIARRHKRFTSVLSLVISSMEVFLGLILITGFCQHIFSGIVLLLMSIFTLTVIVALFKAPHVTCRCFGALSDSQFNRRGLLRSVLLTMVAGIVFLWSGDVTSIPLNTVIEVMLPLLVGYVIFALGVAQAATVIALFKVRFNS